jgi:hypothetical protein
MSFADIKIYFLLFLYTNQKPTISSEVLMNESSELQERLCGKTFKFLSNDLIN